MSGESRSARRRRERAGKGPDHGGPERGDRGGPEPDGGGARAQAKAAGADGVGVDGAGVDVVPATSVLWLAALFALVGGFVEVGLLRYVQSLGIPLRLSPQFVWMTPVAHLLAFGVVAAVLIGLARAWPKTVGLPVVVGVLAGLATYSVLLSVELLHWLAAPLLAAGVGVQMRWLARKRFGTLLVRAAPVAVLVLGVLLVAVAGRAITAPARAEAEVHAGLPAAHDGPNILFIILDTVRAASVGLYDATRGNSPGLEALARDGVVFDRAYSPSPWTLPAHATMFTGVWPHQHRADWKRPLDERDPTVAEALSGHGYATAGFVANLTWADRTFGLERGFARYDDYPISVGQVVLSSGLGRAIASLDALRSALGLHHTLNRVPARAVSRRFLRWHDRLPEDRPFFVFLNYFDAHEPVPASVDPRPLAPLQHRNSLLTGALAQFENRSGANQARFLREYRSAYEAAIGDLDRELTGLFGELERRGVLDNTVVIVTSDHGEQIGEHDLFGHTSSLYRPALWVPLVVRYPAGVAAGARIRQEVSLRDIPSTILDLAGVSTDACCPGRSLAAHWNADTVPADTVFAHLSRGSDTRLVPWAPVVRGPEMAAVFDRGHQYILNGDGTEEYYSMETGAAAVPGGTDSVGGGLLLHLRQLLQRVYAAGTGE